MHGQAHVKWIPFTGLTQSEANEFERIVKTHGRLIFSIAYSILRNPEDAEDVTQDVFFRLIRYRHRLAFIRNQRTFLARVAQRTALDRRRHQHKFVSFEDVAEPTASSPDYVQRQEAAMVAAMLQTLPDELRQVIELSQVEELTSAEIAKVLHIPAGTVRSRLSRAREMLKAKWQARTEKRYARSGQ